MNESDAAMGTGFVSAVPLIAPGGRDTVPEIPLSGR